MSGKRVISLDKVTLRVPRGSDPQAVLHAATQALADRATQSLPRLRVTAAPSPQGEGAQALADRIGRATAARLRTGDGS